MSPRADDLAAPQPDRGRARAWVVLLVLASGCASFTDRSRAVTSWLIDDPAPKPRSIQELYFEAVSARANQAENTVAPYDAPRVYDTAPSYDLAPEDGALPDVGPAIPGGGWNDSVRIPAGASRTEGVATGGAPGRLPAAPRSGQVLTVGATSGGAGLVSEIFEGTDVRQAIQSLAAQANVSVIMDEGIGGFTSAIIENEPFEVALQKVLLPLGLVYKREGGQYLVGKDDPSSSLFSRIATIAEYRPRHISPQELAAMLPPRFKPNVSVVDKRNMIIVEAPDESLQTILSRLEKFDQPVPQVVLEAIVCVLSPEKGFRSGFDWGKNLTLGDNDLLDVGLTGLTMGGSVTPLGLNNWYNDFAVTSLFVRLLAQEGYLTIRAAPRVMAKDGEKAEISIGRETYFSTQPVDSNLIFRQDIERVESGISLNITPVIRGENITVTIEKAEVSEDIRTKEFRREIVDNPYPLINRRRVSTTVNVRDSETIVIGGLVTRQTVDRVSRVPGLGHCPGIGRFFEIVEKEEQDVEVVIFISPRLVPPACVVDEEQGPAGREYAPPVNLLPAPQGVPAPPPPLEPAQHLIQTIGHASSTTSVRSTAAPSPAFAPAEDFLSPSVSGASDVQSHRESASTPDIQMTPAAPWRRTKSLPPPRIIPGPAS
jgi:hypothetical protein